MINSLKRVVNNMEIIEVKDKKEGARIAFDLLKKIVNKETALFLSGGSSPKVLYELISQDTTCSVKPLAFCTVDERWGSPDHKDSNELMIEQTGLYVYAKAVGIEVHKILGGILNRSETAKRYIVVLEGVLARAASSVAIMGIGIDGHTAGIAPGIKFDRESLVGDYIHVAPDWQYPERITITPKALGIIEKRIILAYGEDKLPALRALIKGKNENYSKKIKGTTYLITDQKLA
ncbi:MAG: 6-phosphogluconolactonase [bacterium]|nr:6-phosphogluconolactonase [bacterium]